MPSKVTADAPLKRKRSDAASSKPKKRTRSESPSDDEDPAAHILLLENEILESKKAYNNITKLLEIASSKDDEELSTIATISLCRTFIRLLAAGTLTRQPGMSDKQLTICHWLKERLADYKQIVLAALGEEETASTALSLAMRTLKAEGQHLSSKEEYTFPREFLKEIVSVLVKESSEDARQEFCEKFLGEYCDVRFYTFKALRTILAEDTDIATEDLFGNAFDMLSFFEDVPDSAEELGEVYTVAPKKKNHPVTSLSQQKKEGQNAWLALLRLGPNRDQTKEVLQIMTRSIAPWFGQQPELLADFLSDSYGAGGSISLLALEGVFYLIQHRNLDYPSFFRKLYSLLDSEILHSKHRSRFLRLLDTFLASTHLPAALVASFLKRLSRLCLNAPPAAIVAIIPWMYNLLKKHPLCTFMIHREVRSEEERRLIESEGLDDPFNAEEEDPMETHAIESCMWEVVQLQSHYHPNVATIAKILAEQFTKQGYNQEDFLDHGYSSLMEAELSKQIKKPPVVEYMIPKRVFLPLDPGSGTEDNLLTKLWDFQ
ncbi:putative CCAAT-binding factor domain-containing protein [Seiridium cardinale]|uniref:CCAAT-binding factor domain-containing protein n=1 Tax=Seiridium cardinale TaxID=138064 RepID=A0ABR2XXQ5_9PEZI